MSANASTTADAQPETENGTVSDAEFALLATTDILGEGREASRWDSAVCLCCGRGDEVETAKKRREGNTTVKRHRCARCDTWGATVVEARMGNRPARVRTGGDVETRDLEAPENERFRGTF